MNVRNILLLGVLIGLLGIALAETPGDTASAAQKRLGIPRSVADRSAAQRPMYGYKLKKYIVKESRRLHLDAAAALSVAAVEGGFRGSVSDGGTSFGPWCLHRGGALPSYIRHPRRWCNTRSGVKYVLRALRKATGKTHGSRAVSRIVRWERCGNPSLEIRRALHRYAAMKRFERRIP